MADEQKEPWVNQMALATVILAVCATFSTFKSGGYSSQALISQAMASDQWSFYQAKSLKQHLHETTLDQLRLQAVSWAPGSPSADAYNKSIAKYEEQATRYEGEKKDIQKKAEALEVQRDELKRHGKPFGIAIIFLQVAILLNSIAGLLKKKPVWWLAIPVGLVGLACFADGFFSFLPFL